MLRVLMLAVFTLLAPSGLTQEQVQHNSQVLHQHTIRGHHPRAQGISPQYTGLGTALRGNVIITDTITPDSVFHNWAGKPTATHDLRGQTAGNYDDTHNHYQNVLSEVWNFKAGSNAVAIWGDSAAINNHAKAWGGFFSARSGYKAFVPGGQYHAYLPKNTTFPANDKDYDAQLIGIEIDVLNSGKPGVYPNMSKTGLQIVGFGNPNSMAIEIRSEDSDKQTTQRRGVWESGIYFKNSMAAYGRLLVSDIDKAKMGLDLRRTLFSEGIMQARTEGTGTGIIFNEGRSGELYGGAMNKRTGVVGRIKKVINKLTNAYAAPTTEAQWLSLRAGEGGIRIMSNDNATTLLSIDHQGKLYLDDNITVNGRPLRALLDLEKRMTTLENKLAK